MADDQAHRVVHSVIARLIYSGPSCAAARRYTIFGTDTMYTVHIRRICSACVHVHVHVHVRTCSDMHCCDVRVRCVQYVYRVHNIFTHAYTMHTYKYICTCTWLWICVRSRAEYKLCTYVQCTSTSSTHAHTTVCVRAVPHAFSVTVTCTSGCDFFSSNHCDFRQDRVSFHKFRLCEYCMWILARNGWMV